LPLALVHEHETTMAVVASVATDHSNNTLNNITNRQNSNTMLTEIQRTKV